MATRGTTRLIREQSCEANRWARERAAETGKRKVCNQMGEVGKKLQSRIIEESWRMRCRVCRMTMGKS